MITLPYIHDIEGVYGETVANNINRMYKALINAYIKQGTKGTISLPYWANQIKHPKAMNITLKLLADKGYIVTTTIPSHNWGEANLNEQKLLDTGWTKNQLDQYRMDNKFHEYKLNFTEPEVDFGANKMRIQGNTYTTPYKANGFAKTAQTPFEFDTVAMQANKTLVVSEYNRGIAKMAIKWPALLNDSVNYGEVAKQIVDAYINVPETYNAGPRTSDPRNRNNSGYLNKIGNPVGFKISRALLVIPEENRNTATMAGMLNKYLFIAELNGFKEGTVETKVNFGRHCYYNAIPPHNPVEQVWIERTYKDIQSVYQGTEDLRYDLVQKIRSFTTNSAWHQARVPALTKALTALEEAVVLKSNHKWVVPVEIDMSALTK